MVFFLLNHSIWQVLVGCLEITQTNVSIQYQYLETIRWIKYWLLTDCPCKNRKRHLKIILWVQTTNVYIWWYQVIPSNMHSLHPLALGTRKWVWYCFGIHALGGSTTSYDTRGCRMILFSFQGCKATSNCVNKNAFTEQMGNAALERNRSVVHRQLEGRNAGNHHTQ